MESLTRNNYEIWFLDYLDGQLSNEQLETLLDFLEQNPELKEELRGVSGIGLAATMESLEQKELLLKSPADIPGIATMDQLCIARMENDLPEEEARMFDLPLKEDTGLEKKYAAFQLTRLNPADSVIYPYKKELLRKTRILSPWIITAISSAAVILFAWFLWPDPPVAVTSDLAKIEKPASENQQAPATNPQPTTDNRQLITHNRQPITGNPQPTTIIPVDVKPAKLESSPREYFPMNSLTRKSALAGPRIPDPQSTKILFASCYPSEMINPVTAEDALTLPQYALQLFRERILGENRILVRRTRFSMWEVAGAGVEKINSLAGTNMKFNREYDSKGEIMAVSFNSRFFDMESPIRGQENR